MTGSARAYLPAPSGMAATACWNEGSEARAAVLRTRGRGAACSPTSDTTHRHKLVCTHQTLAIRIVSGDNVSIYLDIVQIMKVKPQSITRHCFFVSQ